VECIARVYLAVSQTVTTDEAHPKRPLGRWFVALILLLLGALVGGSVVASLNRSELPKSLGMAPEKVIPPESLTLLDADQYALGPELWRPLATLDVSDGLTVLSISDADGLPILQYSTGDKTPNLTIYGCQSKPLIAGKLCSLEVLVEPELWFTMLMPDGKTHYPKSKAATYDADHLISMLVTAAYHSVIPREPQDKVEGMITSEDTRLVDREHHLLAVLGLNPAGEPGIALMREDRLAAVLGITTASDLGVGPKEWMTLLLFDHRGAIRVTVALGPKPAPSLTVSEVSLTGTDLGLYALDPSTGDEKPVQPFDQNAGLIPWLSHAMPRVNLPVVLVDQRNTVVWRSP
jgi:hypothetical protein